MIKKLWNWIKCLHDKHEPRFIERLCSDCVKVYCVNCKKYFIDHQDHRDLKKHLYEKWSQCGEDALLGFGEMEKDLVYQVEVLKRKIKRSEANV